MNELLHEVLSKAGFKAYYITKYSEKENCIVYNYIVRPGSSSDNKLESMEYTILLNLYANGNIEKQKDVLINAMLAANFKLIEIQKVNLENNIFNTAFKFKKLLEIERVI